MSFLSKEKSLYLLVPNSMPSLASIPDASLILLGCWKLILAKVQGKRI